MLYIRADMNDTIATGHMMRCLSIADALKRKGENTVFILADGQAVELLRSRGYDYIILHTEWNRMEAEFPVLREEIERRKISRLLIDSYQVTERYLANLRQHVETIYIDDLNAFEYPVNTIICYANYCSKFHYEERYHSVKLYLGTKYVPLREAFWNCREKRISTQVENLLILSGGTDPYDVIGKILAQIDRERYRRIDVICGKYNKRYKMLNEAYRNAENIHIHRAVPDIEKYMSIADVAISAGGTTLYELCACGTPTISYSLADNQIDNVKQFQEDQLIDYAGDVRYEDVAGRVRDYLERYQYDSSLRREKSIKMQQMVDGKGALRLAQELCVR